MTLNRNIYDLTELCAEIGLVADSNYSFQLQLTNAFSCFCNTNGVFLAELTLTQFIEIIRAETKKFNGGAS
uniref:hypothetical protein n=1 Tax=Rheinheimera sp. TaxID=1869214 RepID=UPI0040477BE2